MISCYRHSRFELGFTMVELLTVIAVVGILASIGLAAFIEQRQRGFDARIESDLKNAAKAEEAYFGDNEVYKSCSGASSCAGSLPGISAFSDGVVLTITATTTGFVASGSHPSASRTYTYNSQTGGLQ